MRDVFFRRIEDNAPYHAEDSILLLLEDKQPKQIISEGERL